MSFGNPASFRDYRIVKTTTGWGVEVRDDGATAPSVQGGFANEAEALGWIIADQKMRREQPGR